MSKRTAPVRRNVDPDDLLALADLARIPNVHRNHFYEFIQYIVSKAWDQHVLVGDRKSASAALKKVAQAVSMLNDNLGNLTEREATSLGEVFKLKGARGFFGPGPVRERSPFGHYHAFRKQVWELTVTVNESAGFDAPKPPSSADGPIGRFKRWTGRGRKSGTVGNDCFHTFAGSLLWAPMSRDGRYTFKKTPLSGTWVEAIERLRPYMPPGAVPIMLPASTLERIRDEIHRNGILKYL
jgi:hypothetical protein